MKEHNFLMLWLSSAGIVLCPRFSAISLKKNADWIIESMPALVTVLALFTFMARPRSLAKWRSGSRSQTLQGRTEKHQISVRWELSRWRAGQRADTDRHRRLSLDSTFAQCFWSLKVYTYIMRAYAYKAYAYTFCLNPNNNPQSIDIHQTYTHSICIPCLDPNNNPQR